MQSIFKFDPWDVCEAHPPYMCNVDQSVHKELKVPITEIKEGNIYKGSHCWTLPWWKHIPLRESSRLRPKVE